MERPWPILRHHLNICLYGLRKTTAILSQGSRSEDGGSKPGPPKHEAGVPTTPPRCSNSISQDLNKKSLS
jgi:hypothetical protein